MLRALPGLLAACVLPLLLLPPSGHAAPRPDAAAPLVSQLLRPSSEAERDSAVQQLCAERADGARITPLLHRHAPRGTHVDAARVLVCRQAPELLPLMFEAFLRSKAGDLSHDPDVFERLIRGIQSLVADGATLDPTAVRTDVLPGGIAARLELLWLDPLSGEAVEVRAEPALWQAVSLAVERRIQAWIAEVLEHPELLVELQNDSGDLASELMVRLEVVFLAALIAQEGHEAEVALETARQRGFSRDDLQQALTFLHNAGALPGPAIDADPRVDRLPDGVGWDGQPSGLRAPRTYPVGPLDVPAAATSPVVEVEPERRFPRAGTLAGIVVLLAALLAVVARLRPGWRPALFRVAAAALPLVLLLALEGLLALAGYAPLAEVRPTFSPGRPPGNLFERAAWDPSLATGTSGGRWRLFEADKPEGAWRIFALGASSVHGSNHLVEEAWPAVLERRLRADAPERTIEVINGGTGGAVSDDVLHYAGQALELGADLLILSYGFNDFLHIPRLAAYHAFDPATLGLRFELDRWRLVRLIADRLPARTRRAGARGGWLDRAPDEDLDPRVLLQLASVNMEDKLRRTVARAEQRGVPVLFLLQSQNEELCGPGSRRGVPGPSDECFPDEVRHLVTSVAATTSLQLLDGASALEAHVGDGPVGHAMFWDVIHPTREGHAVLGEAIAPAVMGSDPD
jgi:lysophospholipase L1-like esterase